MEARVCVGIKSFVGDRRAAADGVQVSCDAGVDLVAVTLVTAELTVYVDSINTMRMSEGSCSFPLPFWMYRLFSRAS